MRLKRFRFKGIVQGQLGQLSLEYLLLLAAVMAVFAFLVPALNHVYAVSVYGMDSTGARSFADAVESTVNEMRFLADGSVKQVKASPATQWSVYAQENVFFVEVVSARLSAKKVFSVEFPNKLALASNLISEASFFAVRKQNGKVLIEYA